MPLANDRVKETSSTTGTGAISGFQSFASAFNNPSVVYYAIETQTPGSWEVGIGTFTTTLSRDIVLASSNAGALVNFAGALNVFSTAPAKFLNGVSRGKTYAISNGLALL